MCVCLSEKYFKTQLDNLSVYKVNRSIATAVLVLKSSSCFEVKNNEYSEAVHTVSQHERLKEIGGVQHDLALVHRSVFKTKKAMKTSLACILIYIQLFEGKRNPHFTLEELQL